VKNHGYLNVNINSDSVKFPLDSNDSF